MRVKNYIYVIIQKEYKPKISSIVFNFISQKSLALLMYNNVLSFCNAN